MKDKNKPKKMKIESITKKEAEKNKLIPLADIPGRSIGHALWRLGVHFRERIEFVEAFSIEKYDKKKLGQEGAVKVLFWLDRLREGGGNGGVEKELNISYTFD